MESQDNHNNNHHGHHKHHGHYSQTCRHEIQDFVKCTKERLRSPTSGHGMFFKILHMNSDTLDRGDISECTPLSDRYAVSLFFVSFP